MSRDERLVISLTIAMVGIILIAIAAGLYQIQNPPTPERTERLNTALQNMQWGEPNPWAGQPFGSPRHQRGD